MERHDVERASERAPEPDGAILDQFALGNATVQARMGGEEAPVSPELRVVAEVASPLVERASLALQLDPADPARLARLVGVIEASHLPGREDLAARLHAVEAARARVDAALTSAFGSADAETRAVAERALGAVAASLAGGAPETGGWRDGAGHIPFAGRGTTGSLVDRAGAWIEAIAASRAPDPDTGRATSDLCRALMSFTFDEEEDEDDLSPAGPEVLG